MKPFFMPQLICEQGGTETESRRRQEERRRNESITEKRVEEMNMMRASEGDIDGRHHSLCSRVTKRPARGYSRHKSSNRVNTHFH